MTYNNVNDKYVTWQWELKDLQVTKEALMNLISPNNRRRRFLSIADYCWRRRRVMFMLTTYKQVTSRKCVSCFINQQPIDQ